MTIPPRCVRDLARTLLRRNLVCQDAEANETAFPQGRLYPLQVGGGRVRSDRHPLVRAGRGLRMAVSPGRHSFHPLIFETPPLYPRLQASSLPREEASFFSRQWAPLIPQATGGVKVRERGELGQSKE